jgi:hypothetical protein
MVMSPAGLATKNNCAGKGQQQFTKVDTSHCSATDHERAQWNCIGGGQSNDRYNDGTWLNDTKWLLEFIYRSES